MNNPTPSITDLRTSAGLFAAAFQMIASKDFPGHEARAVDKVLTFLENLHNQTLEHIKVVEAEEKAKVDAEAVANTKAILTDAMEIGAPVVVAN